MEKIKINVFNYEDGQNMILLEKISEYLTEKQLIPPVGSGLTIMPEDGMKLGLKESTNFTHVQTVKDLWYRFHNCDVAVLVHYKPW